jgi:hypothetical protein
LIREGGSNDYTRSLQAAADVQALLPLLATYLGHASYSDTAYYLTGSSDLLAIAAERAFLDGGAA